jgi:hypothetical protein
MTIQRVFPEALVKDCTVSYTTKETKSNKFTISPNDKEIRVKLSTQNTPEQNQFYKDAVEAFVLEHADTLVVSSHRGPIRIIDKQFVRILAEPRYHESDIRYDFYPS